MSETDERCSLIVSTLLDADGRLVFDVFDFDEACLDRGRGRGRGGADGVRRHLGTLPDIRGSAVTFDVQPTRAGDGEDPLRG